MLLEKYKYLTDTFRVEIYIDDIPIEIPTD